MKLIVPEYTDRFKCTAGLCTNSCCIGWDVCIDECTLKKYEKLSTQIGKRIADSVSHSDSETVFFRTSTNRCPFLNSDNLCDIIISLGEDYLSEICREHPRFYTPVSDVVFGGIGMSCEAAARLILSENGTHKYKESECDGFEHEFCDEELLVEILNKKQIVIYKMCEKTFSVGEKIKFALEIFAPFYSEISDCERSLIIELYSRLEYMDKEFFSRVQKALSTGGNIISSLSNEQEQYLCRIFIYYLDRYLPSAAVFGDVLEKLAIALASTLVIAALFVAENPDFEAAVQIARKYSAEIEYSEDNVAVIEDAAPTVFSFAKEFLFPEK